MPPTVPLCHKKFQLENDSAVKNSNITIDGRHSLYVTRIVTKMTEYFAALSSFKTYPNPVFSKFSLFKVLRIHFYVTIAVFKNLALLKNNIFII